MNNLGTTPLALILLSMLNIACAYSEMSSIESSDGVSRDYLQGCRPSKGYAPRLEEALAEIQKTLSKVSQPCLIGSDISCGPCSPVSLSFERQPGKQSSIGQRILVMDGGMSLPALTRHRSRVLDFLEFDDSGKLHSFKEKITIPKAAHEILVKILDERYPELPPCLLGPIQSEFHDKLWPAVALQNEANHGDVIFTKLAELNPEAQFVLIHDPQSNITKDDCSDWQKIIDKQRAISDLQRKQIQDVIERYGITHINFSLSPTFRHRESMLREACPALKLTRQMVEQTIQDDLDLFFGPLFSLPGITGTQAIFLNANYFSSAERLANIVDCSPLPNRLRIGALGATGAHLPIEGINKWELLRYEAQAAAPCIDLAVNLGRTQLPKGQSGEASVLFSLTGIETTQVFNAGSSWAAPLALSYLIHLKKTLPDDTSVNALFDIATNFGNGRIKDPVHHKQFEIYRLGYLQ